MEYVTQNKIYTTHFVFINSISHRFVVLFVAAKKVEEMRKILGSDRHAPGLVSSCGLSNIAIVLQWF